VELGIGAETESQTNRARGDADLESSAGKTKLTREALNHKNLLENERNQERIKHRANRSADLLQPEKYETNS
jgi:hypothetical protein